MSRDQATLRSRESDQRLLPFTFGARRRSFEVARRPGAVAIAVAALILWGGEASAGTPADSADDICSASANPCLVTTTYDIQDGSTLDFGTRTVEIRSNGQLNVGSGTVTIHCGDMSAVGGTKGSIKLYASGTGGSLTIVASTGAVVLNGKVEGNGSPGGDLEILAAGNVEIYKPVKLAGSQSASEGGQFAAESGLGSIVIAALVDVGGGSDSTGGDITLLADLDVAVSDALRADGGALGGGSVRVDAGRDVIVTDDIQANATSSDGFGGTVEIDAGEDVFLLGGTSTNKTVIDTTGHTSQSPSVGGDGGVAEITAATGVIEVGAFTRVDGDGAAPDGLGGEIRLDAGGAIEIAGELTVAARGTAGLGGLVDVTADGGIDCTSGSDVDASGGQGFVTMSSGGAMTLAGDVGLSADGNDPPGVGTFESELASSISGSIVNGGVAQPSPRADIEIMACAIDVTSTAAIQTTGASRRHRLVSSGAMTFASGSSVTTDSTTGTIELVYRDPGQSPQILGTMTPSPTLILNPLLSDCAGPVIARTGLQNPAQAECIIEMNDAGSDVLSAQSREAVACIKAAGREKIGDADACIADDARGRVAGAIDRAVAVELESCTATPNFGFAGATVVGDSVSHGTIALYETIFGSPIQDAIDTSGTGQKCQKAVARSLRRLMHRALRLFNRCKERGLDDGSINSALALSDCALAVGEDGSGKLGRLLEHVRRNTDNFCALVDTSVAFPGDCGASAPFVDCLYEKTLCRFCRMVNEADDLDADCDLVDDGQSNASCQDAFDSCPTQMTWTWYQVKNGQITRSDESPGFDGHYHHQEILSENEISLGLDCSSTSPPSCGSCGVTGLIPNGNCRCDNATRTVCDPNGDDCGGAACYCYLAPPTPWQEGGALPTCVLKRLVSGTDVTGTWDVHLGVGELSLEHDILSYFGGGPLQVCPTCDGDVTPRDGIRDGTCSGGPNDGQSCDEHARSTTFPAQPGAQGGGASYDCWPSTVGGTAQRGLAYSLTTALSALPSPQVPCTSNWPVPGASCHCGVCSGDSSVACSSTAECSSRGIGTCTNASSPGLVGPLSAGCDLVAGCSTTPETAPGTGVCLEYERSFCDGVTYADGRGILECSNNGNAECDAWASPACQGGSCGVCPTDPSIGGSGDPQPCFLSDVVAPGVSSQKTPLLAATYCLPYTNKVNLNNLMGLPGPARVLIDGTMKYE